MGFQGHEIRKPAVAGTFYPGDPRALAAKVDRLLEGASAPSLGGDLVGLIAPHAGYDYSGATAAAAYRALAGSQAGTVVVLAPSHHEYFEFASILDHPYETPLGTMDADGEFIRRLIELDALFQLSEAGHGEEHSLEVHLPFLQRVLPGARIVPVVLSEQTPALVARVGRALAQAVRERPALIVASSDLYHGHDEGMCRGTDKKTLEAVVRMDADRFLNLLARREIAACGGGPVGALMVAARDLGADRAEILARTNSSEASGRTGGYIVGYAAVAFVKGGGGAESADRGAGREGTPAPDPAPLDSGGRLALLALARESVERAVRGEPPPDIPKRAPAAFLRRSGAFVTLHRGGRLRGCIGYVEAQFPLARAVIEMARAAALEDFRFPPVTEDELQDLDIEISVLSEPVPVDGPAGVEPGRHGLIVARGRKRGLLLPQVATEQGWDRSAFVSHTCLKAGLPADAWRDPETELLVFEAQVFGSGVE